MLETVASYLKSSWQY